MLLIGEGTAEIQKMIVGRRLLEEYSNPKFPLVRGGLSPDLFCEQAFRCSRAFNVYSCISENRSACHRLSSLLSC